ncbi:putative DnaJ domain, Chaperone J-domain superfamily [Helianthus annuus]|uniref:DnaJ domain, Chaperone J-domain superfamily n=1 Tax=Helianthus annuus TaxID=4232 RepID=A0A251TTU0_HELAN|nr:chaperone protein DnaJ [Helianthus annuus]XP_021981948.1 chaperone protein DnaJ [Helianthus annuus]KAF5790049.1 putative DnaJ domain, Chaperone J-domain superfamily [Helianthus annuus]KAJ0525321.1 putative DnaJ domain, Chaperone J-domain superfamily [Helianthus annuus]KAJ0892363.1 putative DnaJ domain, Chaperone J-domain superfamily [Helianthus annuus]
MRWDDEQEPQQQQQQQQQDDSSYLDFDTLSLIHKPKDYYRILEVDYEATEEQIRSNFIRLALKWHPDKKKGEDGATSKFQEINEAYQVLSDPIRKEEYDRKGMLYLYDYNIVDYLNRYKGLILTCNGLGMKTSIL